MRYAGIWGFVMCLGSIASADLAPHELTAKWIWHPQDSYTRYNDTIVAARNLELPAVESASLIITADTKYRLFINGDWVNDGPSRNWPDHYQYDVIDAKPFLKEGTNSIRVIAKYFGVGTFHEIPQQAGLLVQLDVKTQAGEAQRIISDESWMTEPADEWLQDTPKKCIQMGPYEIYDAVPEHREGVNLSQLFSESSPEKAKSAAVLFAADAGPWKNLTPRDCPLLTRKPFPLKKFVAANFVNPEWHAYTFPIARLLYPGLIEANGKVSMASAVATTVVADGPMTLHVEAPHATVTINGQRGDKGAYPLQQGENLLLMAVTDYFGHWQKDVGIRFIEGTGYSLRNPLAEKADTPWVFVPLNDAKYVSSDYEYAQLPQAKKEEIEGGIKRALDNVLEKVKDAASLKEVAGATAVPLETVMQDPHWQFEAREVQGDALGQVDEPEGLLEDTRVPWGDSLSGGISGAAPQGNDALLVDPFILSRTGDNPTVIMPSPGHDIELIYDLGEQNIGFYDFQIYADAGTVLDIAEVEYIAPDGRVQFTGPYRNSMRYICGQGRQHFTSLERRSGRFVFLTLRNQTGPVRFHHFQIIESTYPVQETGQFTSSDPRLDQIWEISARTLKLCMEDTYTDCPLYEQTHWVGDARNEGVFGFSTFGARDLARRCVLLTGHSLEKYPIALCQTPSTWETLLPAWSFLWGISVWDYYEYSGDADFVKQVWPMVMKNLKGARDYSDDRGLFSGPFWNMFDWSGIDDNHSTVTHNSMFAVGAIDAALKCAEVVGDAEAKQWLQDYRAQLLKGIEGMYDAGRGAYLDSVHEDGSLSKSTSVHTSFLSLLYDIAKPEQTEQLLKNVLSPPEGMVKLGSPFAAMYEYEALEKCGRQDAIIQSIYDNYLPMLEAGATTVWESFPQGTTGGNGFPTRSHTHAWSSAPVHFLNRIVLGILPAAPGGASFSISPRPSGLAWAKGASACAKGKVEVDWKLEGKVLTISAKGPEGVALNFAPNEALNDLEIVFNGQNLQ